MKTRIFTLLLCAALFLSGCTALSAEPEQKQYTATFLTLFDTVTTVVGRAESEEAFTATAQAVHDELLEYHQLFDIYNDYEGIVNIKTLNDTAGTGPVTVDRRIIDLLLCCKDYYALTGGKVNVAMGSVLKLWHEAREDGIHDPQNAALPDAGKLEEAAEHTDLDCVVIDEAASTVHITDPQVQLDVGAIAKGWAAQQVSQSAPEGLLISVGGNVCARSPKADGSPWVVGVQDPEGGSQNVHTLYLSQGSMVTSGDYQRYYTVDGQRYHHIIDPETLYPSEYWCSVTIVCGDSGLADALSTALFLLPQAEGQALLDRCDAEAMWVGRNGGIFYSPGFENLIRT